MKYKFMLFLGIALFLLSTSYSALNIHFENYNSNSNAYTNDRLIITGASSGNCVYNLSYVLSGKDTLEYTNKPCNTPLDLTSFFDEAAYYNSGTLVAKVDVSIQDGSNAKDIVRVITLHGCTNFNKQHISEVHRVKVTSSLKFSNVKCSKDAYLDIIPSNSLYLNVPYVFDGSSWEAITAGIQTSSYLPLDGASNFYISFFYPYSFAKNYENYNILLYLYVKNNKEYTGYHQLGGAIKYILSDIGTVNPLNGKITISNTKTCPDDKTTFSFEYPNNPYYYYTLTGEEKPLFKIGVDNKKCSLSSSCTISNVNVPQLNYGGISTTINLYGPDGSVYNEKTYNIMTYPLIGPVNYAIEKSSSAGSLNCYDMFGLPAPCKLPYGINIGLSSGGVNGKYHYLLTLVENNSGYINRYTKIVSTKDTLGTFSFIGASNKKCNYTVYTDISSFSIFSQYITEFRDGLYMGRVCPVNLHFQSNCVTPSSQKIYHDFNVVPMPVHINYGINESRVPISNSKKMSCSSPLYGLFNSVSKISCSNSKIVVKGKRYHYTWDISGLNWLISVLLNNSYVPIRVGYNQVQLNTHSGSVCAGNSVCYTELPYCGDGICDTASGESCLTCPQDCGCAAGTLGCYGVPNVNGFTDSHGCILRYKQYEENCTFNDECDASKGLTCVHTVAGGGISAIGHCCKSGEIWDPTTPKGFNDANPNIKGTCRVPRGVNINHIELSFDGSDLIATCSNGQCEVHIGPFGIPMPKLEYASRLRWDVDVSVDNPNGEHVCVLVATEPDYCACNGGINNAGGAEIKCAYVIGSKTFTFWSSERSPYFYLGCHRYCRANAKMMVLAWIPQADVWGNSGKDVKEYWNQIVNITDWNNFWGKFSYSGNSNGWGYYSSYRSGSGHVVSCSDGYCSAFTQKGEHTSTPVYTDLDFVNGHPGNVFRDKNNKYNWADLVIIKSSSNGKTDNDRDAGGSVASATEYRPYNKPGHGSNFGISGMQHFMCGGYSFW